MEHSTNKYIRKVAVLGAGVMGAQIAAHLVNAKVDTVLFDLPSEGDDHYQIVNKAKAHLRKIKPSPLADDHILQNIGVANYDDDAQLLSECDLIIEAISERMDWKRDLYQKITPYINNQAILATNTSGLGIDTLSEQFDASLRSRFCGVHFFNPPRYMHLAELIPCNETKPEILNQLETFLVSSLGKGVVRAKDTPNFIANRIGVFSLLATMHHAQRLDIDFDIADALTGPLIGRPKSATFRTMDVVGLDTMVHVVKTMADNLKQDPWFTLYDVPHWLTNLIDKGALGQKTKQGIYKKLGKEIHVLDRKTGNYRISQGKVDAKVLTILKTMQGQAQLEALKNEPHPQAQFLWSCFRDVWHYCAYHAQSIANNIRDIDLAMRWGFGWQHGPFELWSMANYQGVLKTLTEEIEAANTLASATLPGWLHEIDAFYLNDKAFAPGLKEYVGRSELPVYQRQLFKDRVYRETHDEGITVFEDAGVRLWHLKDDIAILSFKSKVNAVGEEVLDGILEALPIAERDFKALVIWQSDATNFSVGANLKQFAPHFLQRDEKVIEAVVEKFQRAAIAFQKLAIPTVAAVRGRALGGGCELVMHCDKTVCALETYIGLVEVGVGLLPAGGGCKELAYRAMVHANGDSPFPVLKNYFQTVAMGNIATSGLEAKSKGFVKQDSITLCNSHEVLFVAKKQALAMAESVYRPPLPVKIKACGREGIATLKMMLVNMLEGRFISEYEYEIAGRIAHVMCGGDIDAGQIVDEEWYLRLEREAFVALACQDKTHQRIQHMLETGKPLRN